MMRHGCYLIKAKKEIDENRGLLEIGNTGCEEESDQVRTAVQAGSQG